MAVVKHYTKGELTVKWEPSKCIHSEKCWHGLPQVFDAKRKPWIDLSKAEAETIRKQVRSCPSGALSLPEDSSNPNTKSPMKVSLAKNGPILIQEEITLCDAEGNEEVKKGPLALCRCGASNNKPFCDGTHSKVDFKG